MLRPPPNILSVDVEDYFQVSAFAHLADPTDWEQWESRVEVGTETLLEIFSVANVRATFFVLGWVAKRFPDLVARIASQGHELASHSYWHRLVYDLDEAGFRSDLRASREAIEDAAGVQVTAFRAPSFSITKRSLWALDVLIEEGFTVDSSIFPMRHDRYGIAGARGDIHVLQRAAGSIIEVPPSVWRSAMGAIPVGGGYFRLFPLALTRLAIMKLQRRKWPAMIYTHPWEFDPEQPVMSGIKPTTRFRHYVGLTRTKSRLARLLNEFRFAPLSEVLEELGVTAPSTQRQRLNGSDTAAATAVDG